MNELDARTDIGDDIKPLLCLPLPRFIAKQTALRDRPLYGVR